MSSTNKTTNYELSQFVGSDKPTWLGDYNSDMGKIDTQMKANNTAVVTAQSTADTASTTANTANATANTANTTANTANTNATTALNKALANEISINKILTMFNLSTVKAYATNECTNVAHITLFNNCNLSLASNSDNSIYKLYGSVTLTVDTTGLFKFKISTTLRPDSDYSVKCAGVVRLDSGSLLPSNCYFDVAQNGEITITGYTNTVGTVQVYLFPCLYFNKTFGDVPENN